MKKNILFLIFGLLITLCCGCSSGGQAVSTENDRNYDGYQSLSAGKWDDAISVFQEETGKENVEIISYLGLARAQIGAEKFEEAKETLIEANGKFPDTNSVLYYLGQVSAHLEDYELASDCYYDLIKLDPEDEQAGKRLNDNLSKVRDFEKVYRISKELYQENPEGQSRLKNLLWACSKAGIETHIEDTLGTVRGSGSEYTVQTLYDTYKAMKSGDQELAMDTLFQSEHWDDLVWDEALYFGDCDADGVGNGIGIGIQKVFGSKGAMIGLWKNGVWEGNCAAWQGERGNSTRKRDGVEYSGTFYRDTVYQGEWKDGEPAGPINMKQTYHTVYEGHDEFNNKNYKDGTLNFTDGKAQGNTIITQYYYSESKQDWYLSTMTIHEFQDGFPQPFKFNTVDGEKMVYEVSVHKLEDEAIDYEETACDCKYIW